MAMPLRQSIKVATYLADQKLRKRHVSGANLRNVVDTDRWQPA